MAMQVDLDALEARIEKLEAQVFPSSKTTAPTAPHDTLHTASMGPEEPPKGSAASPALHETHPTTHDTSSTKSHDISSSSSKESEKKK